MNLTEAKLKRAAILKRATPDDDDTLALPPPTCAKTKGCRRPAKHPGHCSTLTPEQRRAKESEYRQQWQANRAKQPKTTVAALPPVVSAPPVPPVLIAPPSQALAVTPRCRFEILFEEELPDGTDRIAVAGRSRAEFERYVLLLARVIQEGQ